ncbi:MAG TPA: hypothetical protein VHT52_03250 [Stellaceae bacterium]|nr:hypothetical protein [Stellaceae bacterium]
MPAPADRAGALGRAGTVLSHDTSKELRPDEIPLMRNARLLQLTAGGVDWVPTRDLPRELLIAANKGRFGAGRRPAYAARTRDGASTGFAVHSPLEGNGFELPVPVRQAKLTRSCR